jgi:hypothetical protein
MMLSDNVLSDNTMLSDNMLSKPSDNIMLSDNLLNYNMILSNNILSFFFSWKLHIVCGTFLKRLLSVTKKRVIPDCKVL